jgi:hypothetical protein
MVSGAAQVGWAAPHFAANELGSDAKGFAVDLAKKVKKWNGVEESYGDNTKWSKTDTLGASDEGVIAKKFGPSEEVSIPAID